MGAIKAALLDYCQDCFSGQEVDRVMERILAGDERETGLALYHRRIDARHFSTAVATGSEFAPHRVSIADALGCHRGVLDTYDVEDGIVVHYDPAITTARAIRDVADMLLALATNGVDLSRLDA